MLKAIKTIVIILLVLFIAFMIFRPSQEVKQPIPEVPCEELNWMRDLPQARCVEYWKEQNKIEEA